MQWFTVMCKKLQDPINVPETVYSMDEKGVLVNVLSPLQVSKESRFTYGKDTIDCGSYETSTGIEFDVQVILAGWM